MIDKIDQQLRDWVAGEVADAGISLLPPKSKDGEQVWLHLMAVLPSSPAAGERRPPLQIMLRYLLTTWSQRPETAHRMLSTLIFAAMEHPEYEVDLAPVANHFWLAFGITPRPGFCLSLPLRLERAAPGSKLVQSPLEIKGTIR